MSIGSGSMCAPSGDTRLNWNFLAFHTNTHAVPFHATEPLSISSNVLDRAVRNDETAARAGRHHDSGVVVLVRRSSPELPKVAFSRRTPGGAPLALCSAGKWVEVK